MARWVRPNQFRRLSRPGTQAQRPNRPYGLSQASARPFRPGVPGNAIQCYNCRGPHYTRDCKNKPVTNPQPRVNMINAFEDPTDNVESVQGEYQEAASSDYRDLVENEYNPYNEWQIETNEENAEVWDEQQDKELQQNDFNHESNMYLYEGL